MLHHVRLLPVGKRLESRIGPPSHRGWRTPSEKSFESYTQAASMVEAGLWRHGGHRSHRSRHHAGSTPVWDDKAGEVANEHITVHGTTEPIELDDEDEGEGKKSKADKPAANGPPSVTRPSADLHR